MDIVYAHGETTALQIAGELPDPPCHAAVRTMIRILEARGRLKQYKRGIEFVYQPTAPRTGGGVMSCGWRWTTSVGS